jgi:mRNA interferase RelE/StbE
MWRLVFSKTADKQLAKMDAGVRRIILAWLLKNVDGCVNPRAHGKGLEGNLSGAWRYRIGDYRVLCELHDKELVVLAFNVGHKRDIYKR